MQPNVKKGSLRKPIDLIQFPWEKPETKSVDFIKNNLELFDKIFPKVINNE
jgi:hypothetical protein